MAPRIHYLLRIARPADIEWLWALKVATLRPYVEATWGSWNEPQQRNFLERGSRSTSLRIVVIPGEGDVGVLDVARRGSELYLGQIELLPAFQRRGIGSQLIQDLQQEAQAAGKPLRLQVLRVNPARHLYHRLGFQDDAETATHWLMSWTPPVPPPKTASPPGQIR